MMVADVIVIANSCGAVSAYMILMCIYSMMPSINDMM